MRNTKGGPPRAVVTIGLGWLAGMALAPCGWTQGGVTSYCDPGEGGIQLTAVGSADTRANDGHGDLSLYAEGVPIRGHSWFVFGDLRQAGTPFGSGELCVAGTHGLYAILALDGAGPLELDAFGTAHGGSATETLAYHLDYQSPDDPAGVITSGSTWYFQLVHRAGAGLELSNALEISFGPPAEVEGWKLVENGHSSQHPEAQEGGILLIESAAEWAVFEALHSGGDPPGLVAVPVDFEAELVLVVFAGTFPNAPAELDVVRLSLSVTTLEVETELQLPGSGCAVLPVIVQPHEIVRLPRVENLSLGAWNQVVLVSGPCY